MSRPALSARPVRAVRPLRAFRVSRLPPVVVRPLSRGTDELKAAVEMAREWGEAPFYEDHAFSFLLEHGRGFVAFRNGEAVGLLLHRRMTMWSDDDGACAFAPLVWGRGRDGGGAMIPSAAREQATLALVEKFLDWAEADGATTARVFFRNGMTPAADELAALGLGREFRVALRKAPLPGDAVSGRVRWFSTEPRAARGQEMNLPPEKMFPELFSDALEPLPPVRRLVKGDEGAAVEVARAARAARGLPFSAAGFRSLLRAATAGRERCALGAFADAAMTADALAGVVVGFARAHPFADGGMAAAEVLECRPGAAKAARRATRALWREFVLWGGRGLCRAMLTAPPFGKFGDEFMRRHRLAHFGACWRTAPGRDESDQADDGENTE